MREYLACHKILEDYKNQLEKEQKNELKSKIDEYENNCERSLAASYSILVKYSAKNGFQKIFIKQFKDSLEQQVATNVRESLTEEGFLIESVGLMTLKKHNLLPGHGLPVQVRKIYEAFLQFDDKPMFRDESSLRESLLQYCMSGEIGIAAGKPGEFNEYYHKESVPFFDVEDTQFWLVDKTDIPSETAPEPGGTSEKPEKPGGGKAHGPTGDFSDEGKPEDEKETVKESKSITISGNVDVANYNQIFTSFIMPLKLNNVEIEIRIKGKTNETAPLYENSDQYKITKESAKQLGLDFKAEEK